MNEELADKGILIVEDDADCLALLEHCVRRGGYGNVLLAHDGSEAIRFLKQKHGEIYLIITDILMPKRNGLELVQYVRARYHHPVGIIVISGYSRSYREKLKRYDTYVFDKPVEVPPVMELIDRILNEIHILRN